MAEVHPFPDEFSPVGSAVYYAIRFAPSGRQSALSLINAFYRSLRTIPLTCSDPGVATEKLNWWQREMQCGRQSTAHHPIARAMSELIADYALPEEYFAPLFQAVGREIGSFAVESDSELDQHCNGTGALFADLAAVAGDCNEVQREAARELGSFIRMVEIVQDLGFDLRRSRCFVPRERLRQHQLSAARLLESGGGAELSDMLCAITERQQQRYRNSLRHLSNLRGLGPVLSLAAIAERVLQIVHGDGYRSLLTQRTSLTPLHKLWISWRCQRRID